MDEINVKAIEEKYPIGSRVELVSMDDPQAPEPGTRGTVRLVDDAGQIVVDWDTGSGLSSIPGVDVVKSLVPDFTGTVVQQIMDIRDSGLTNMLDAPMVQRLAFDRNYYELVNFIEEHKKEYTHFIMAGQVA